MSLRAWSVMGMTSGGLWGSWAYRHAVPEELDSAEDRTLWLCLCAFLQPKYLRSASASIL